MDPEELNQKNGMENFYLIVFKLYSLFKEDSNLTALTAYESFEKYRRPEDTSVTDYLIEIDQLVAKLKGHKISLPEPVLGYRALKSANLSEESDQLVKATVSELTLDSMSIQLKKVMGNIASKPAVWVKKEVAYASTSKINVEKSDQEIENSEVFYNNNLSYRKRYAWNNRRSRRRFRSGFDHGQLSGSSRTRTKENQSTRN